MPSPLQTVIIIETENLYFYYKSTHFYQNNPRKGKTSMENRKVVTKPTLEEDKSHGTKSFPFQVYRENYRQYPMGVMDLHWHRELELDLVLDGTVHFKVGDEFYRLEKGEGIFINSNHLHLSRACDLTRNTEHLAILFAPEFLAPKDSDIFQEDVMPFLTDQRAGGVVLSGKIPWQREILLLARSAADRFDAMSPGGKLEIHADICQIWQLLIREVAREGKHTENHVMQIRTRRMLAYIREHYGEPITVKDLAGVAGISRSECFRCFQRYVGQKPFSYINGYRLMQAAKLLRTTDLSICEVGIRCGFNYQSYFGKMFREAYGQTPFAYRKSGLGSG